MRFLIASFALCLFASSTVQAQYRNQAGVESLPKASSPLFLLTDANPLLRHLSASCEDDRARGREAAGDTHSGSGWMVGGLASGLVLGLIGTGIIWAVASSSSSDVDRVPDGVDGSCYRAGYAAKAKSMNSSSALTGGLLGTLALVVLVVSATSGSSY